MYDLIVLGGGPAGYLAAERAGHGGLNTLLIEKRAVGGVCLNEGCVPSKTLLHSAKVFDHAVHGTAYGVAVTGATIDQKAVIARKDRIVRNLVAGIRAQLKGARVTLKEGFGEILGRENGIVRVCVGGEVFESSRLIVATGSEAIVPPIPGVKEGLAAGRVLTNREILALDTIPRSLVVVGGGVIGLEMASYFAAVGSKVTVIEMLDKIAGPTDRGISSILQRNYEKKGVTFRLSSRVTAVSDGFVAFESGGVGERIEAEKVLLSIGRRPVTTGFGLETLGVHVERGRIVIDEAGRTSVPGVFAAGDVDGEWMLAHAAYREAEVIVANLLGRKERIRHRAIPSVIYTNPEVASVGETEESCRAASIDYRVAELSMNYSGRYMAENDGGDGICKILVDPRRDRMIGCHLIGSYASEIVTVAAMLIEMELKISEIKEFVFPHPSVGEIIRETLFSIR
jgi:dihydrolipoamide dehydrogenase